MSGTSSPGDADQRPTEQTALVVLAANYRDLDMDGTGRLQDASPRIARSVLGISGCVVGCVVLPTCNRFEVYCEIRSAAYLEEACSEVLSSISRCTGLSLAGLRALFEVKHGAAVTEHLFTVGAGLDSLVLGEREITGQVRRALASAQVNGTVSGRLTRLFQAAARTARDIAARARLSVAGSSVASVALDLAADALAPVPLGAGPAVIIGSGIYAGTMVDLLKKRGCTEISVFSRSGRAEAFAAAREVAAVTAAQLPESIARAHLVIGCSGTGERISLSTVAARRHGRASALVAADLAPSRDFDPRIADLPGVQLLTLQSVRDSAPPSDMLEVQRARALVRHAAGRFEEQEAVREVDGAIIALRHHVEQILECEMDRVRKAHGCTGPAADTSASLRRVVRRLLHEPAVRARELAAAGRKQEYTAALEALFGITVEPAGHLEPGGSSGREHMSADLPDTCGKDVTTA